MPRKTLGFWRRCVFSAGINQFAIKSSRTSWFWWWILKIARWNVRWTALMFANIEKIVPTKAFWKRRRVEVGIFHMYYFFLTSGQALWHEMLKLCIFDNGRWIGMLSVYVKKIIPGQTRRQTTKLVFLSERCVVGCIKFFKNICGVTHQKCNFSGRNTADVCFIPYFFLSFQNV